MKKPLSLNQRGALHWHVVLVLGVLVAVGYVAVQRINTAHDQASLSGAKASIVQSQQSSNDQADSSFDQALNAAGSVNLDEINQP